MPRKNRRLILLVGLLGTFFFSSDVFSAKRLPLLKEIQVQSSIDRSMQPALMWLPKKARTQKTPMLVFLHSWSGNYKQNNGTWQKEAVDRGWIYLHPHFRGANKSPKACGSRLAKQDILDAISAISKRYKVDSTRIYLAGHSGGGHMAMLMAGYHPSRFSAVSSWCGISNLKNWYLYHAPRGREGKYAKMVSSCCGGKPGHSQKIDAQYKARSPWQHLKNIGNLPFDLNAGVYDGQKGSVPFYQSLRAFNAVANAHGDKEKAISEEVLLELWNTHTLNLPEESDIAKDKEYERAIILRRQTGKTRVTIFDGNHESLAHSACNWLAKQQRQTKIETKKKTKTTRKRTP